MKKAVDPSYVLGPRATIETISAGKVIDKVFISKTGNSSLRKELRSLIQQKNIPFSYVPTAKLSRLTSKNHQGVIARLSPIVFASLNHVVQASYERGSPPLVLLLDGITDVRNFGAILRTAICAGVDTVIIPSQGSAPVNGEAMKTSAGALAHLPICRVNSLADTIEKLKASGLQVVACHERASKSVYHTRLTSPLAIILGAEGSGIAPLHLKLADDSIHIPTLGPITSLNVSVAAAIVLYEHMRQQTMI